MLSKLILLLGAIISTFIAYSCIHNNQQILKKAPSQEQKTDIVIEQENQVQQKSELKKQQALPEQNKSAKAIQDKQTSSFIYQNSPMENLQLSVNSTDKEDPFLEKLNSYCQEPLCTKALHFEDNIEKAPWKEEIFQLIDFIRDNHVKNVSIKIENHKISISGEFSDKSSIETINKILNAFEAMGFDIQKDFSVIPKKEIEEQKTSLINEIPRNEKIKMDTEETHKITTEKPEVTLEDVQKRNIQKVQTDINALLKNNPIYFKHNSNDLTLESKKILDKIIDIVNRTSEEIARLKISGHTDASGSAAYNKLLSQKRAEKVRNYLIDHHIKVPVLEAVGYGEENPISKNPYAKENRRVEIEIKKEKSHE
jgi:outer membrane protein OmpA-like peptidoglycan-associated protein